MSARTGRRLRDLPHLARRFFWSLRAQAPDPDDEAWLVGMLSPAERHLYDAQPVVDRAHSVACAVAARDGLVDPADEVIVASALHDVGKAQARLGTVGRAVATVLDAATPDRVSQQWAGEGGGWRARMSQYVRHDHVGAELLRAAGSAPVVVAWAAEHHRPASEWSIDPRIGRVLLTADG